MSPTFGAADALLRDYESKALFGSSLNISIRTVFSCFSSRFRWATSLIEHVFTLLVLVSLIIRYVWSHTVVPLLSRFYVPGIRKRVPISFQNETVLITGGQ